MQRFSQTAMTPEEAEALVRRHLERTPETPNGPTVADMAEALRLPPEEVAKLLAEVRSSPQVRKRVTTRRERRVWLLSLSLACLVLGGSFAGMRAAHVGPFQRPPTRTIPSSESFEMFVDDMDHGSMDMNPNRSGTAQDLSQQTAAWLDDNLSTIAPPRTYSYESAQKAIRSAEQNRWEEIEGVRFSNLELRKYGGNGQYLRWARIQVPIYDGDDALVTDAVARERARRIQSAIDTAMRGIPPPSG